MQLADFVYSIMESQELAKTLKQIGSGNPSLLVTVAANLGLPDRLCRELAFKALGGDDPAVRAKGAELSALLVKRAAVALKEAVKDQGLKRKVLDKWRERLPKAAVLKKFWTLQLASMTEDADLSESVKNFGAVLDFLLSNYPERYESDLDPRAMLEELPSEEESLETVRRVLLKCVFEVHGGSEVKEGDLAELVSCAGEGAEALSTLKKFLGKVGLLSEEDDPRWDLEAWLHNFPEDKEARGKISCAVARAVLASKDRMSQIDKLRRECAQKMQRNGGEGQEVEFLPGRLTTALLSNEGLRATELGDKFVRDSLPAVVAVQEVPKPVCRMAKKFLSSSEGAAATPSKKRRRSSVKKAGSVGDSNIVDRVLDGKKPFGEKGSYEPGKDFFSDFLRASELLTNIKVGEESSEEGCSEHLQSLWQKLRDCPHLMNLERSLASGNYFQLVYRPLAKRFSGFSDFFGLTSDQEHLAKPVMSSLDTLKKQKEPLHFWKVDTSRWAGEDKGVFLGALLDSFPDRAEDHMTIQKYLSLFDLDTWLSATSDPSKELCHTLGLVLERASEGKAGEEGRRLLETVGRLLLEYRGLFQGGVKFKKTFVKSLFKAEGARDLATFTAASDSSLSLAILKECSSGSRPWMLKPLKAVLDSLDELDKKDVEILGGSKLLRTLLSANADALESEQSQDLKEVLRLIAEKHQVAVGGLCPDDMASVKRGLSVGPLSGNPLALYAMGWAVSGGPKKKKRCTASSDLTREVLEAYSSKIGLIGKEFRKVKNDDDDDEDISGKLASLEKEYAGDLRELASRLSPDEVRSALGTKSKDRKSSSATPWQGVARRLLRHSLSSSVMPKKGGDFGAASLVALSALCSKMYGGDLSQDDREEVEMLASMVLSHSAFLPTLMRAEDQTNYASPKAATLGLLEALVRASPHWTKREMVPTLLGEPKQPR